MADWIDDADEFGRRYAECGYSIRAMSREFRRGQKLLSRKAKEHGINPQQSPNKHVGDDNSNPRAHSEPSFTLHNDEARIVSPRDTARKTPEDLMVQHGLDPEDWEVVSVTLNEWEMNTKAKGIVPLSQLKVSLRRKKPVTFVVPARTDGPVYQIDKALRARRPKEQPKLWVFCGDQQAPNHDPVMHVLFCQFLEDVQPDEGVLVGDTLDFTTISRHRDNPEWDASAQECIDTGYVMLRDYRESALEMRWRKLLGNHDDRIRTEMLTRAERLYGLRRAQVPGQEPEGHLFSIEHLLRLDELGIELVRPNGDYHSAQFNVSDKLAVRHGNLTGKNAVENAISRLDHSLIFGHTHGFKVISRTIYGADRRPRTIYGFNSGCMCRIEGGLGYAVDADWANTFLTAWVYPDGSFVPAMATFDGESLKWHDRVYTA